jgi:hypothetical protein
MQSITVDQEVIDFVKRNGRDYRVSTSCSGPVIVPITVKSPKDTDVKVRIGENILYISRVQARYINRVTPDMLDESRLENCSIF